MTVLLQDLRQAFRALRKSPGFTLAATVTLALGIGASTAIFALLHAVVLAPLPYPEPERLVALDHPVPGLDPDWAFGFSEAGYFHFAERSRSLAEVAVYEQPTMTVSGEGPAEQVPTAAVSANLLQMLGARPALGRLLVAADNEPGAPPVAVLSHAFWSARFGADPRIIGESFVVEGVPFEVVGVLGAGFTLPASAPAFWWPVPISPGNPPANWHRFSAVGRTTPGATLDAVHSELAALTAELPERFPSAYGGRFMEESGFGVRARPLRDQVVGGVAGMLWILFAAVGLVLVVACANVANLFLVRVQARSREVAIRAALGATRGAVARRYVTEALLLTLVAGGLGLLLADGALRMVVAMAPGGLPRMGGAALGGEALGAALLLAVLTGLVLGALPALGFRSERLELREGARGTASARHLAARGALVAGQVALALVLLTGAGLLFQTFQNLRQVDPGFDPGGVLALDVALPAGSYPGFEEANRFYRELVDRIEALPGVVAAGATQSLPLVGGSGCALVWVDDPEAQARSTTCFAAPVQVTPGYFRAMGIEVRGSVPDWEEESVERRRGEVVVAGALERRLWPGGTALGRGIRGNDAGPPFYAITGVAGEVRSGGLGAAPVPIVYFPMLPAEGAPLWSPPRAMSVVVRVDSRRPEALAGPIREIVASMDPQVPVGAVRPMERVVADSMAGTTFLTVLLLVAAAMALLLGIVGLYGVVTYAVEQRRAEIGIRMALGAAAAEVAAMVLRQSAWIVGMGVGVGIVGSLLAGRGLGSLLFGVGPADPVVLGSMSLLLLAVALLASWLPARRATRVDPMIALRAE